MDKLSSLPQTFFGVFANLRTMLGFAWRTDKKLFLGFYGLAALGAFFPIAASFIFKLVIDYIVATQGIAQTVPLTVVALVASIYITNLSWDFIVWGLKDTYFDHLFRYKMEAAAAYEFFKKVSSLDIEHLEDTETQNLITKTEDTFTWRVVNFLRQFGNLFNNFVSFAAALIILLPFGLLIPFIIAASTLPKLFLRARFGRMEHSLYGGSAPEIRKMWYFRWLLSQKTAVSEGRVLKSQEYLLKTFNQLHEYMYCVREKPVKSFLRFAFLPEIVQTGVIFLFAYLKLPDVVSGAMTIGTFTFFINLLDRIANSVSGMVNNFGEIYEDNFYIGHYLSVLALPPLLPEPKKFVHLKGNEPPHVEFRNVSFKYPANDALALNNVSFIIDPGENVAIVGPNGAGKTTIVKLLCRFYDVTSGEILINGINIKKLDRREWYEYLGTLFQEFIHYELTVRDNITLGRRKEDNDRLVIEAAKKSGAHEFIQELPNKYDQILGRQFEGGIELSIGQWQKLAIARAFYEAAPVLILDEPTSAIDAEAEFEIFKNLNKFYKEKTLVFISHRFSTVRNADKIIVMRNGEITETGNHKELLENVGVYARMFRKQAKGYID
ncbi:ABC transporter ATP-binding protein [Candidatus Microgenomates bacterium]|nr:ABC transporter ATP-binding protein [Candidatus Microgenomates bacterium]